MISLCTGRARRRAGSCTRRPSSRAHTHRRPSRVHTRHFVAREHVAGRTARTPPAAGSRAHPPSSRAPGTRAPCACVAWGLWCNQPRGWLMHLSRSHRLAARLPCLSSPAQKREIVARRAPGVYTVFARRGFWSTDPWTDARLRRFSGKNDITDIQNARLRSLATEKNRAASACLRFFPNAKCVI